MSFSLTQISLVIINLAALNCLEDNEIKILFIKMVPKLVNSNCLNCRLSPLYTKLQLPKLSEEYFTKEPSSVRDILYDQLKRLTERAKSRESDEREQLNHEQLIPKPPTVIMLKETKSPKLKEYLKILRNATRLHDLRISRGKPTNKRANEDLRMFHKVKYIRNELLQLKSHKLKRFLKYLKNGTLEAKSPMIKGYLRRHPRRGAYKTINRKDSKDGQGFNKTEEDKIDINKINIEEDFVVQPEGFFEKMKDKFINFIERLTGRDYVKKQVRRK